ncbi:MAG TPA: DUF3306 domain-containing protein [Burkholderiales bacterium]
MAAEDKEAFLSRWSRRKQEQARVAPATGAPAEAHAKDAQAPALPPVDKLTPESDFAPFMHPKVAQAVRRVALKKLFADPHFNVPDLNEAYSGDWTGGDPISEELLKTLNQARTVLYREEEEAKQAEQAREAPATGAQADEASAQTAAGKTKDEDGTGRQDA